MKKTTMMVLMAFVSFCGYAQFPQGFEGAWTPQTGTGAGGPSGWAIANIAGPINPWIQGNGSTQQPAYQGTHSAFITNENVATNTQSEDWLITPLTTVPANGQLRFWSRLFVLADQQTDYFVKISTVTTGANPQWATANFTNLVQWEELELNPQQLEWAEKVVSLSAYAGQQVYIAFVMKGDNGDRWVIDDVNVLSQCLDPTNLTVSNQALTSATLSWTNPGSATSWDIEIVPAASAPTGNPTNTSATTTYNATSLTQNTDYKYYVRAHCPDGGISNWVGPLNFGTVALGESCAAPIAIGALPYSTTDTTANYADLNYEGSPGATGCGITSEYLNGNDVVYSYTPTQTGVISIDLSNLTDTYAGMFVYNSCASIGVGCIAGDFNSFDMSPLSIPSLSVTAGTTYYIVISTWASPQTVAYSLTVQQVNCAPPVGLPTTGIGMTSANLSWTNPSGATSWEVVVQPVVLGIPSGSGTTVNTNTNWAATGLITATAYEYYVRANCGNGTFSAWAGPYAFNTMICEVAEQCTYTVVMTDTAGDGWNGNTMTLSQNGIALATVGLADGYGPQSVTVPVCNGIPVQLFWNAGGDWAGEVGVSLKNSFAQTIYNKPAGTGIQNSILYTGMVDCDNILCLPPSELTVSNTTTTTATIGWAGPATGNWNYYVVEEGGDAPGTGDGINTTTNPVNLTGLTISTNYEFYIQMVCEDGTSTWAGPFAFSTDVCEAALQCDYTFIMTSDWWIGYAGATMVISQNGTNVATIGATFTTGQTQTVTVPLCTETPFEVYWATPGNSSYQVGLEIINGFDQSLFEMLPYEGTPGTTLFTSVADCDTPACLSPEELYAGAFTTTTAQLGWAGPATGNWAYYIVPAGGPAPTAASTPTGTTTTNPVTISTGLTIATNYDFYVRAICEGDTFSPWSDVQPFNTAVCPAEDQCNYIFVLTDDFGDGWNGNTMTVYQGGVPVGILGPTFTSGEGPVEIEIAMCPGEEFELFWNTGGSFTDEVAITVLTPFEEDVYTKPAGTGSPGTTLYTGDASCTPPTCPKPQDLAIGEIQLESAELSWTEMGSATSWEIIVVPYGDPAPAADAPVVAANVVTQNPATLDGLESGTTYQVYIRAICSEEDGNSNWSGPIAFTTALVNDDCDGAIAAPVNAGANCIETITGTITGATGSGEWPSCSWMEPEWDVWYTFEATGESHAISINQEVGAYHSYAVYEGDGCGNLTEFYCDSGFLQAIDGLTTGATYYIQVYSTYIYDDVTSFELCITSPEPPIYVSETDYTVPELISEIFLGSDCAYVDNFEFYTGTTEGQPDNGIGYWQANGSSFQFQSLEDPNVTFSSGIVLVTGDAEGEVPGPNTSVVGGDFPPIDWDFPTGEETVLTDILATFVDDPGGNYQDPTSIKFDFAPLVDMTTGTTLFQFLFASDEYGNAGFECQYSDVFAFILTDLETGQQENLAILPNGQLVLVTNIHPDGGVCGGINEQYFGQYNSLLSPTNFNGQSVLLKAQLPFDLVAGHEYSMQMVIANQTDGNYGSAVYLMEGSFNVGEVDLGPDLLVDNNTAACSQEEVIISSNLDPDDHTFVWYHDGVELEGETGPTLVVTESGVYTMEASVIGIDCVRTGNIVVEFYADVEDVTGAPITLYGCDVDGFATFDLTENTTVILAGDTSTDFDFTVEYYLTEAEATEGTVTPLNTDFDNTIVMGQTLYARIENTTTGCFAVEAFEIVVQDNPPVFTVTDDFSICAGTSGTITVVPGNFNLADVTFSWTIDDVTFAGTTEAITVTQGGVYEVAVNSAGCIATAQITVTVTPIPVAQEIDDITVCDSYTLGALDAGNAYFTQPNGGGVELFADEVITGTQDIYILASSGTTPDCTSESVFTVTIVPSPVIVAAEVADVAACDTYVLPALTVGAYYAQPGGVGPITATELTGTQTVYVYASSSDVPCTDEESFTVTITPTPVAAVHDDVVVCDIYNLEPLAAGNVYYTGPGATGQLLPAGAAIIDNQTIYIHAAAAENADCYSESSFDVVIIPTPEILLTQGCNDLNQFELGVDFIDEDELYNEDLVTYTWKDEGGNVVGTGTTLILSGVDGQPALGEGTYQVTVTPYGDADCPATDEILVASIMCTMPRGISPNNDGDNDSFDLTALDVRKLVVFNRYGAEVYSFTGNYTDEFAGVAANGENLPTGTYFYMVERANGETLTGWVYVNWENN